MSKTPHAIVGHRDERGSALIGVLLLLMMMSALVAALAVSGQTETLISRNQHSGAQAQAAAEAGLNHAVELATAYIFEWKSNEILDGPDADSDGIAEAIQALLIGPDGDPATVEDNGSLGARVGIDATAAIPLNTRLEIDGGILGIADGFIIAEYEASIMDDEPPCCTAPAAGPWVEDGDPFNDLNQRLVVRATGYGPDNTKVVLEAIISPLVLGALVTNGDLNMSGNVSIAGTEGSVHSNSNLTIDGSVTVSGTATASGEWDGPDEINGEGGRPEIDPFPEVRAEDYLAHADFILTDEGTMTDLAGTPLCTWSKKTPCNHWDFDDSTLAWSIGSAAPPTGTYYVEGRVNVTGSPGSAENPVVITIIATGSINISGSPDFTADTPELLFVTDADLEISGGLDAGDPLSTAGQMLVHEQLKLSGNPELAGQLIVEDAPSEDNLVTANEISGNVTITYNGGLGSGLYTLTGWRDIRQ